MGDKQYLSQRNPLIPTPWNLSMLSPLDRKQWMDSVRELREKPSPWDIDLEYRIPGQSVVRKTRIRVYTSADYPTYMLDSMAATALESQIPGAYDIRPVYG